MATEFDVTEKIQEAVAAYNTAKHASTGYSPFFMVYHRDIVMPFNTVIGREDKEMTPQKVVQEGLVQRMQVEAEAKSRLAKVEWKQDQYLRSEEHTSELQSLMRISYAVFCLKKKKK